MKKASLLLVVLVFGALPAFAQTSSTEFGVMFGGSKRISSRDQLPAGVEADEGFELDNSVLEVYYGIEIEPGAMFKVKAGRINTPISVQEVIAGVDTQVIVDNGNVDHISGLVEYRFSEAFGSTALFAGAGLYRSSADDVESATDYGVSFGVNGDFPLTRRYGIKVEGAYHWTALQYRPRYITATVGLRVAF